MMDAADRPTKRILVRWSDELDKTLLLAIQYACSDNGVKLPWSKVAEAMGPKFSEGAIVQHLAKLRNKMAEADLQVPPPLRRGSITKEPSKIYATPSKKRKNVLPLTPASISPAPVKLRRKCKGRGPKTIKTSTSDDEDDDDNVPDLFDSDDEENSKKSVKRARKSADSGKKAMSKTDVHKSEPKTDIEDDNTYVGGPATRTRGININFAKMQAADSDDEGNDNDIRSAEVADPTCANSTPGEISAINADAASPARSSTGTVKMEETTSPLNGDEPRRKTRVHELDLGNVNSAGPTGLQTPTSANGMFNHALGQVWADGGGNGGNDQFDMYYMNNIPTQHVLQSPFPIQSRTPSMSTSFDSSRNNSLVSLSNMTPPGSATFNRDNGFGFGAMDYSGAFFDRYLDAGYGVPNGNDFDEPFPFDQL